MILLLLLGWTLRGPEGAPTGQEQAAEERFQAADPPWGGLAVRTDPGALAAVAADTLRYLRDLREEDPLAVQPGLLGEAGVTLADVELTLARIVAVAAEDEGKPHQRLQDPAWIEESFRFYAWTPDSAAASGRGLSLPAGQIRLTQYVVWQFSGSEQPSGEFSHALYSRPADETDLTPQEAEARRDALLRYRYTRSQVMAGVYADGGAAAGQARPLIWLTRQGVYEAMMQGTIEVMLPGGGKRLFNVDRNNGMAYKPSERDPSRQDRYWYFNEVDGVLGWGDDPATKVRIQPEAAVAGDVYNLGLGKLIALRQGKELRLVVLADTGGAFQPNLFQLDYFAGVFPDKPTYQAWSRTMPGTAFAGILIARPPPLNPPEPQLPTP